jgi:hypothetical protein
MVTLRNEAGMSAETAAQELTGEPGRRPEPGPARRKFDLSARILASDAKPPVDEATPVEAPPVEPPRRAVEAGARLNALQPLNVDPAPVSVPWGGTSRPLKMWTYGGTLFRPNTGVQGSGTLRTRLGFDDERVTSVSTRLLRLHFDLEGRGALSAQEDFGGEPEPVIACTPIAPSPRFTGEAPPVFSHLLVVRPHPTDVRVISFPATAPIAIDVQDRLLPLDVTPEPGVTVSQTDFLAAYTGRTVWLGDPNNFVLTRSRIFAHSGVFDMPACVFPVDPPAVFLVSGLAPAFALRLR